MKWTFSTQFLLIVLVLFLAVPSLASASSRLQSEWDNTFSIVARDPETGALAAAVSTARFAVGNRVPFVEYNVGAVATQANTNVMLAKEALNLLRDGSSAVEAMETVLGNDPQSAERQLSILDAKGGQAAFTGTKPDDFKNHLYGKNCIVAGNILVGPETLVAMVDAFEATTGSLGDRVMAAMEAGQKAGGDRRGKISAAMVVAYVPPSPYAYSKNIDLRVDSSKDPVADLRILYNNYKAAFKIK
ncbi:MAG: DUF1028 domain-containing protein [Negativicutes bacterium]